MLRLKLLQYVKNIDNVKSAVKRKGKIHCVMKNGKKMTVDNPDDLFHLGVADIDYGEFGFPILYGLSGRQCSLNRVLPVSDVSVDVPVHMIVLILFIVLEVQMFIALIAFLIVLFAHQLILFQALKMFLLIIAMKFIKISIMQKIPH